MNIKTLFNEPKIIGLIADQNEGKTNLVYYLLEELNKDYDFNVYTYGLRCYLPNTVTIHSVAELEQVRDSIIILDEISSLFNLEDRKIRAQIENTIRLVFHNNNILLLVGLAENFKKFLSAKLSVVIFKKVTLADLINGSRVKNIIMNYKGNEKGSAVLELAADEAIIFDGKHYHNFKVPYLTKYDTKAKNVRICVPKCGNNVLKNVEENVDYIEIGKI